MTTSEIVRIAFELFAERGYDQVSVEMIAEAAGISRATFFNHFPTKDLILRELASVRAERIAQTVATMRKETGTFTREDLMKMIVEICRENVRTSFKSKKLLLDALSHQISRGFALSAREKALVALTDALSGFMHSKIAARIAAEVLFCIVLGTMLEWLMREDVPEQWLEETMTTRVQVLLGAVR
jgi:AcrR family transcriptional regulator